MTKVEKAERVIKELIHSDETHWWIADAMSKALGKDPVDAANNFEVAAKLFNERLKAMTQ